MRKRQFSRNRITALEFAGVMRERCARFVLLFGILTALSTIPATAQQNLLCTVNVATATCDDVTAEGISYTDGTITVLDVNNDVGPDPVEVNSGVIGIELTKSGLSGSSGFSTDGLNTITDAGATCDGSSSTDACVVVDESGDPILTDTPSRILLEQIDVMGVPTDVLVEESTGTTVTNAQIGNLIAAAGAGSGFLVGSVTVNNSANFQTTDAGGIVATSTGGDGGQGGTINILLIIDIGLPGGAGTNGESVSVTNSGEIIVGGTDQHGILATSRGGRGGDGGGFFGALISVPGAGGNGSAGGEVSVILDSSSAITTHGDGGHGVLAQSLGGDGGSGGNAVGGLVIGSKGGNGGDADTVFVANAGSILTNGAGAYGIYASSVGAGAGSGSISVGTISIGGNGGGDANGGAVTVNNSGLVETTNVNSYGIFAQSIGGGGGDGGSTGGLIAIGGRAGSGGNGDTVEIINSGSVQTALKGSTAIFAQSIGGGGGNGGNAVALGGGGVAVAIGGKGGSGGNGGMVIVNKTLDVNTLTATIISTTGNLSHGIQAQSIGGGGGNGGAAIAVNFSKDTFSASFAIGGSAGDGGAADQVTVNKKGEITTSGNQSSGIFAQSVGGGGGNGGGAVALSSGAAYSLSFAMGGEGGMGGDANTVTVNAVGDITTSGNLSHGVFAQSVGGGGGNGGFSVAVALTSSSITGALALGGEGGSGGNGGSVFVNTTADVNTLTAATISTTGDGSTGIFAQSVGGGGGNGGIAGTLGTGSGTLALGLGGNGGPSGIGEMVHVINDMSITTIGNNAIGILAQSVGGGGGNGGFAFSGTAGVVAISAAIGGNGGSGGGEDNDGGEVTVDNSGDITTTGALSYGILAQSIGGGGGNGGVAISGALAVSVGDTPAGAAAISVGGNGGDASDGRVVTVNNSGSIETKGLGAHAISAQSIGGGGGNGGFAGSVAVTVGGSSGGALAVAVGGVGGEGGNADAVDVTSTGEMIITHGHGANGIHVQSIGGGGGDGGFAFTGALGIASELNVNLTVSVGGDGGEGGTAGSVTVDNQTAITTHGDRAHGIYAQSIGGGGGNGGTAMRFGAIVTPTDKNALTVDIGVTVGGKGGNAATGGTVDIINAQAIKTTGLDSYGIYAQSIGGGGGNGGASYGISLGLSKETQKGRTVQTQLAIGGAGGDGNTGGDVTVTNSAAGRIETTGDNSHGIFAQSIGGGGGDGGAANALNIALSPGAFTNKITDEITSLSVEVVVGGNGGIGDTGGKVTVDNSGAIITRGAASRGIWAQSIGGGGGNGGQGALSTGVPFGADSLPLAIATCFPCSIQNLVAPADLSFVVGGNGGTSANADKVTVTNDGDITTFGSASHAIFAQSIGGGGGDAKMWYKDAEANVATGGNASIGANGKFGLGGAGGAAGDGGAVDITVTGSANIETSGNEAFGIFAQSIGGGGGTAGSIDRSLPQPVSDFLGIVGELVGFSDLNNIGIGLGLLRDGGNAGDGKTVTVTSTSNITTHGSASIGIFAQSIGGGGGLAGGAGISIVPQFLFLGNFVGSVGGEGSGGDVIVSHTGSITTSGEHITDGDPFSDASHGIFAQSAGGINAGTVDVILDGEINTTGRNSIGIIAQSIGDRGTSGDITITVAPGSSVIGGTLVGLDPSLPKEEKVAAGVQFLDGATNLLTNRGLVTTQDGLMGMAIAASGGHETIDNFGTVTGSFDLGAGGNSYTNEVDSFLNSGKFAYVGDDNLLLNHGRMSPGGDGVVMTTEVLGNWQQSATGTYGVDLDLWWTGDPGMPSKEADRVNVIGATSGTADLTGIVDLMPLSKGNALPGDHEVVIVSADGKVSIETQTNLVLVAPPSAVASYELLYPNDNDIVLGYHIDFSPDGLNRNQTAVGGYINDIELAFPRPTGDPGANKNTSLGPVVAALFDLPDVPSLQNAYDQLSPEIYADTQIAALFASLDFSNNLLSCRVNGTDTASINREGQCLWVGAKARFLDSDRTRENIGYDETAGLFAAGAQVALDPVWRLGFGVGYQRSSLDNDTGAESDGDQVQGGIALKYNPGALLLAGVVSGGRGWYDTTRPMAFGNFAATAHGDHEIDVLTGRLHASYVFGAPSLYFKPIIDVSATRLDLNDVTETGAGGPSLIVHGDDHTVFSVSPALEVGSEWWLANGTLIRPFVRAGVTWFSDDDVALAASFAGAPDGVGPFTILVEMDQVQADVAAGLEMVNAEDSALRLYYDGHFGDTIEIHSVGLKASAKF